jgi:hypothetical protein
VLWGAYHFGTGSDGIAQADHFSHASECLSYRLRLMALFPLSPRRLPPHHLLGCVRVSRTVHFNPRDRLLDLAELVGRQVDVSPTEILLQPMQLGRAGDRNDPRFSRQ